MPSLPGWSIESNVRPTSFAAPIDRQTVACPLTRQAFSFLPSTLQHKQALLAGQQGRSTTDEPNGQRTRLRRPPSIKNGPTTRTRGATTTPSLLAFRCSSSRGDALLDPIASAAAPAAPPHHHPEPGHPHPAPARLPTCHWAGRQRGFG